MKQTRNKSQKRQPNQRKVVRPGKKSLRGFAETVYAELKQPCCFSLTPTCHANLQNLGRELGCSASEVLERFSRLSPQFQIFLQPPKKLEDQSAEESSSYMEAESLDSPKLELFDSPDQPFNKADLSGG